MARKKFKLSKSLFARLAAIGVLSAMGGIAIYQSTGDKSDKDDEVSENQGDGKGDDDSSDDDSGNANDNDGSGDNDDNSGSQLPKPSDGIRVANRDITNPPGRPPSSPSSNSLQPPTTRPSTGSTSRPPTQPPSSSVSTSLSDSSSGSSSRPGGLAMPSTRPPGTGTPGTSSPRSTVPGSTSNDESTPPIRTISLSDDENNPSGPSNPLALPTGGANNGESGSSRPNSGASAQLSDGGLTQPGLVPGTSSSSPARPLPGVNDLRGGSGSGSSSENPNSSRVTGAPAVVPALGAAPRLPGTTPSLSTPNSTVQRNSTSGSGGGVSSSLSDSNVNSNQGVGTSGSGSGTNSVPQLGPPPTRPGTLGQSNPTLNPRVPSQQGNGGTRLTDTETALPSTTPSSRLSDSTNPRPNTLNPGQSTADSTTGLRDSGPGLGRPGVSNNSLNRTPTTQGTTGSTTSGTGRGITAPPSSYSSNSYNSTTQTPGLGRGSRTPLSSGTGADSTSDTPGGLDLDGVQSPSLVMEKRAPREIQVGRIATFETVVRNVGPTEAADVIVTDRIPAGTRLDSVTPEPIANSGGLLVWNLGAIKPGREQTITMNLLPERKGEIGSVAQVTFSAQVGVRTVCTQPELVVEVQAPEKVLIGQDITLHINVKNNGDGAASNVVVEEDVPTGVSHPEGREIQYPIGTLGPGESRQLALTLRAESASQVRNLVSVTADNQVHDESTAEFEVIAPQLQISMTGPRTRYLERMTIHRVKIDNRGTASATNVEIVVQLPKGLQFQETNNHGTYDAATHAVYWGLEELPPGASDDSIQLVTLPVEPGEHNIDFQASADLNLVDSRRQPLRIEQLAELFFEIDDVADPIEIGSETMYHLRVTNQGSKVANQVRLKVEFPLAMEPVDAEGPISHTIRDQTIWFEPIERLAPGQEVLMKIHAKGRQEGDHRVVVSLISDESETPVIKQASTNVYLDR